MRRIVFAVALASAAVGVSVGGAAPASDGKLVVREHRLHSGLVYTEGYVSFVRVRDARSKATLIRRRFDRRVRLRTDLPAGRYRVIRFIRPCDGNCEQLDPRIERCAATVDVAAGPATSVAIRTRVGHACEVRVRRPTGPALRCPPEAAAQIDTNRLVGMKLTEAEALAGRFGCLVRVVRLDGEWQLVTDDYRTDRINVWVEDDSITHIDSLG